MKTLIKLHVIAAIATTSIYTWMTHGDWAYILAMMALYNWVLGTAAIIADIQQDKKKMKKRRAHEDGKRNQTRAV